MMAIIKPEPGTSYAALRAKHPPKRTERMALNVKARPQAATKEELPEEIIASPVETPQDKASHEAVAGKMQEKDGPADPPETPSTDPVSEVAERHDAKPVGQGLDETSTGVDLQNVEGPDLTDRTDLASDLKDTAPQTNEVSVRGSVLEPASGVFPFFDKARPLYSARDAMKGMFRRIDTGKLRSEGKIVSYPGTGEKINFTTKIPTSDYELHRNVIDPLGLISPYTVRNLILQRILDLHLDYLRNGAGTK